MENSMIKEVAFVAVAVSDFAKSKKFYEETLELKPELRAGRFSVGRIRRRRHDDRRGSTSELAAVARRNDGRV